MLPVYDSLLHTSIQKIVFESLLSYNLSFLSSFKIRAIKVNVHKPKDDIRRCTNIHHFIFQIHM